MSNAIAPDDAAPPEATRPKQPPKRPNGSRGESGSGRSKPRASLACISCRQRKIKCSIDPLRKSCASCRSLQISCVVSGEGDRRKAASRENIAVLQDRMRYLESIVVNQRPNSAQTGPHVESAPSRQLLPVAVPNAANPNLASPQSRQEQPVVEQRPDSAQAGNLLVPQGNYRDPTPTPNRQTGTNLDAFEFNDPIPQPSQQQNPAHDFSRPQGGRPPATEYSQEQQVDVSNDFGVPFGQGLNADRGHGRAQTLPSLFADPNLFGNNMARMTPPSDKDSTRLDVDDGSGQPRFYGPTSQSHIHEGNVLLNGEIADHDRQVRTVVNMDSRPVRNQLLQTFWKAQPLSQALIDQELFEAGKRSQTSSGYFSDFLENSMLACASRMRTSADVRALGHRYAERAAGLIARELERPNIATLQGFLLLSDYEATRGRNRLGYMYCGIGCRMVFDLGLQESCNDLIARGKLSASEACFRHMLFLGAYVYDHLWSLYLGRPSAIPSSYLTGVQRRIGEQGWEVVPTLRAWVDLATNISEVSEILNNSPSPLDWPSFDRLTQLDAGIDKQCTELPASLLLNMDQIDELPAAAYGLHIQFRGIRIVLHRLLSKALSHNQGDALSPQLNNVEHSRAVMHENAISIARLASAYEQIFGIENFITVMLDNMFVAAVLLITNILRHQHADSEASSATAENQDRYWLRCLADMLQAAQKHYPVTARMRSALSSLVENGPLSGFFGSPSTPTPWLNIAGASQSPSSAMRGDFFAQSMPNQQDWFMQPTFEGDRRLPSQDMDMTNMMSWVFSPG